MYLAPYARHHPYLPAPRHAAYELGPWRRNAAVRETSRGDKPGWVRLQVKAWDEGQSIATQQRTALMSVDELVASVLQPTGRLDERRRTLAFFLSDNGYMWGSTDWWVSVLRTRRR
jgi:hypothetical protein